MSEMVLREINYKIRAVIEYLKEHGGHDEKLYNHNPEEADSDIVEYAEDVEYLINNFITKEEYDKLELPF